ncbi:MAG: hypothetical protein KDB80_05220 [Planctomycetes bacterium]|nr:hypothetical protein [Planctomycetota bacterium]
MKQNAISWAALVIATIAAFLAGRGSMAPGLDAQDPGSTRPVLPPVNYPGSATGEQPGMLVYTEENGGAAAANGILAVTGSYGVGTSVLYVLDTVNRQLAVYEARGGGSEQRRVVLVGARKIDLDLQLRSYNDESEYQYESLERMFESRRPKTARDGTPDPTDQTGDGR